MMKLHKISAIFLAATVIASCGDAANETAKNEVETVPVATPTYNELAKADWIMGRWQSNFKGGSATEIWEKQNDSTFGGRSFVVAGKDTVSSEQLRLVQEGDLLYYIPTVKGQNNNQPVKFKMIKATGDELIFENPEHDFPQKISYKKVSADSIVAEISGNMNGVQSAEQFPMSRVR
jgi:hypothetical protein